MAADAIKADVPAAPTHRVGGESWTALAAWAADELGVRVAFDGKLYRIEEDVHAAAPDASTTESAARRSWFRRRSPKEEAAEGPEPFATETPAELLGELVNRLRERPEVTHARPVSQPTAVHDLSAQLFAAYKLDGGQAHLAGCHFDDVPLVRLTWVQEGDDGAQSIEHRYYDELGEPLEWSLAEALGVDRVAPLAGPTPRIEPERLARMLESVRRHADVAPSLETVVWAKRAWGRLRFEFSDQSIDAPFEGWARLLKAPPVVCPLTGVDTYHLTTIEGGEIAAAEQVGVCDVTKHRRLLADLVKCSATGRLAEPEYVGRCAASGEPVLKSQLVRCDRCGLLVAPAAKRSGDCDACRRAKRVGADDPRLLAIVAKHPKLAKRNWALTETPVAYVIEASGWFRRRVASFDKESLTVIHAAEASRMSSVWRPVAVDSL
ncbi:hypothetical protein [Botrimarina mediterranea]|uniref:Uncharacterized protein n=1 Tax=Botrimarina mediterranea TaxID=2528022 RepID=A0A518KE50_9BACT|nr:hypothetical protein [Botrimarina mediterranea]QDV76067.1 hypothetical protein Spa11_42910 [Botrimarina mediterranea]QDV80662.1 hypothetical protein K2D_42920 [Planctomycetes bacterium K2D]